MALLALIWGSSFLWIKLADRGFPPVEVTFARLALGAAVLFPVVLVRREEVPRSAPVWGQIVVAALFANAIGAGRRGADPPPGGAAVSEQAQ